MFERPREKIRTRGAPYLTTTELLQVVLGSGSAKVSGARLAKRVTRVLATQAASYEQLIHIDGIGVAKACQVLAALELGRRFSCDSKLLTAMPRISTVRLRQLMARHRKCIVGVYFFDGAGKELFEKQYTYTSPSTAPLIVKQIATDALAVAVRSVVVAIGSRNDPLHVAISELDFIKQLQGSLYLLTIQIAQIYRANAKAVELWSDL